MIFSGLIDLLWIGIWGMFWNNEKYYPKGYWENTIHSFVLILSCLNFALKVIFESYLLIFRLVLFF